MQDILASIKRIIADPAAPVDHGAEAVETPPATVDDDVLHLGEGPAEAPPAAPTAPGAMATAAAAPSREADDAPLLSGAAHAASAQAMATLASITIDPHAATHTLDGLVRELLRPMLKEWLDANLPELVERVVTREVARLGGR